MVVGAWNELSRYAALHPRFPEAFDFLKQLLEQNVADGHHVMPGTDVPEAVYVNLATGDVQPKELATSESHRKYIDVQVVLSGEEAMYVPALVMPAVTTEYQEAQDYMLYAPQAFDKCHVLRVKEGNFVIFFENELHAPSMAIGNAPSKVRKAVLKVLA